MRHARLFVLILLALSPAFARAEPPKVKEAKPDNGQQDVDPALRELRVVFDQPMNRDGSYSVVGGGETFPKSVGRGRWLNDRTFVMPIQLQPDHDYRLSINSTRFQNFRGANGEPAVPYEIAFRTAAGKGGAAAGNAAAPRLTPEQNKQSIAELREAIDRQYSYRDDKGVDWDATFKEFAPRLEAATTPAAFATAAGSMLAKANDVHITLKAGDKMFASKGRSVPPNMSPVTLPRFVPGWKRQSPIVITGRFDDGIAYVLITAWDASQPAALEPAFEAVAKADPAKGIIIDVRPNAGGAEGTAQAFAGLFTDAPKRYARNTNRSDGNFQGPYDRVLKPNPERPHFPGKVVVLMGRHNMSSCEAFLLMMKQTGRCTLVGERSFGSSGNPKPVELSNGVTVFLPSWRALFPDGTLLEGVGVPPDVEVKTESKDFLTADPVLDAGLRVLRSK